MLDLEDLCRDPKIAKTHTNEEKFLAVVELFSFKVKYMSKCLGILYDTLPRTPKEKQTTNIKVKSKDKLSLKVLDLMKLINPENREFIYTEGRRKLNSRTECAKILLAIRKMERANKDVPK